jgi:hypothetical protein
LLSVGGFAAEIPQTLFVRNLDANEPRVCHGTAANLLWRKRVDECENVIAYNGRAVWLVAVVPVLESFLQVPVGGKKLSRHDKPGKLGCKKLDSQKVVPACLLRIFDS